MLDADAMARVSSNVGWDLRTDFGDYDNSDILQLYFLFDGDAANNENLGLAAAFDIFDTKSNITGTDDVPEP